MKPTAKTVLTVTLLLGTGTGGIAAEPTSPKVRVGRVDSEASSTKLSREQGVPLAAFIQVADGLFCGSEPKTEADFAWLAQQGVRTLVSVDGVQPNLELANQYHLRYVHIPLRYQGVSRSQHLLLAAFADTSSEPTYVHCHHGQHRGPTAAAILGLLQGQLSRTAAIDVLRTAGTSRNYPGLWNSVRQWQPIKASETMPILSSSVKPQPMTDSMAEIDRFYDQVAHHFKNDSEVNWLRLSSDTQWLLDSLTEFRRMHSSESSRFRALSDEAKKRAAELRAAVSKQDTDAATSKITLLGKTCVKCHTRFRN
ncbi:MAG: cytochrome c [Planctomycetota bacterium]